MRPGLQSAHAIYSESVDASDEVVVANSNTEGFEGDSSDRESEDDSRYLVRGRLGCLEIDDISYNNFCETAQRVIACDTRSKDGEKIRSFYFDVQILDDQNPEVYQIKNCAAEPPFFSKIFAALRKPLVQIRVADSHEGLRTMYGELPSYLKVTAPDIGYRYVYVRWNMRKDLESNSIEFRNSAVKFLFPQDKTSITKSETFSTQDQGGLWQYDLDLQSGLFLNEGVQRPFSEITGMENLGGQAITHPHPEIIIYKSTDKTKQQRAVQERERQRMEQVESQGQKTLVQEAGSKSDKSVAQPFIEPRLRDLKERQASRLQTQSVYKNPGGTIGIPKYGPSLEPAIRGGSDFPTLYARVLTLAEIEDLQKQLQRCENELLQREVPKVCDMTFHPGPPIRISISRFVCAGTASAA